MNEKKETFHYTYSAVRQQEIKRIREKYAPTTQEEDKMEQLRRLDRSVTKSGTIISLTVGIISTLVFGAGMSCTMVWADRFLLPGIIVGIVGMLGMIATYPIYTRVTKKRREKLAPEILRLSDELMK